MHSMVNTKRLDADFLDFGDDSMQLEPKQANILMNEFQSDPKNGDSRNNGNIGNQNMRFSSEIKHTNTGNQGPILRVQSQQVSQRVYGNTQKEEDAELGLLTESNQFNILTQDVNEIEKNLFTKTKVRGGG